jgi:hypothetical protein
MQPCKNACQILKKGTRTSEKIEGKWRICMEQCQHDAGKLISYA